MPNIERTPDDVARVQAIACEALEHVDITLTNMWQVYSAHALSDTARAKVASERDRVRAVLATLDGGAR